MGQLTAEKGNKKEREEKETSPELCQRHFKESKYDSVHLC